MKSILVAIGTRPEAIKLIPILKVMSKTSSFKYTVCVTGQHTDLLDPFLLSMGIKVNFQFENHEKESTLHKTAARILSQFGTLLFELKPDLVLVQGDTTTAFVATLAAFYSRIPVAHVEAGLRTNLLYSPWPEEAHRCLIDKLATYFFTPTLKAKDVLLEEGVPHEKIWVVGNTSIDAVRLARNPSKKIVKHQRRVILVTIHRRENHGEPLKEICTALRSVAILFPDVQIIFFLHPNPSVYTSVKKMLSNVTNIDLREPVDHYSFVFFIDTCTFVITDSGGIQEEAPFMGKPILIVRNATERTEGIEAGTGRLVGTKSDNIIAECRQLLENPKLLASMSKVHTPYGDGYAAERIVKILESNL